MKVRPLQDRILVKRIEEEETTKGGIIIPDTAKEKPQQGIVKAVGKGKILENGSRVEPDVKKATKSFLASIPAAKSKSTVMNTSLCARTISSASLNNRTAT